MAYSQILYEAAEGIATITLNRPDRLNAWTGVMASDLRAALKAAEADKDVRVIILTGAGRGFCAGADMEDLKDISAAGGMEQRRPEPYDPAARADYRHPQTYFAAVGKPILAAVNGPAAGMGLAILLFCDLRFVADSAVFVSAFSRRGLIAEHGTAWMLTRLVGHSRAMDILLSSRKVGAEEAYRMGLADRVVPAGELMDQTRAYARELVEWVSPRSMRVMKRQLWNGLVTGLEASMAEADEEMALSLGAPDFKEGVASFVEKRKPKFAGV
ncbi:MAG: enoyl-CoA hydratase [Pseudomonadota bacterium]